MILYEPFNIVIDFNLKELKIIVIPLGAPEEEKPVSFALIINGENYVIHYMDNQWVSFDLLDNCFAEIVGTCIYKLYDKGDRIFKKLLPEELPFN